MRAFLIISLFLALSACGRSTPTNYYMLESGGAPLKAEHMPAKTLRVAQVESPGYLNRNNIVSRVQNQSKLILAQFHLWAEPVSNGVRRVVETVLIEPMLAHGISVLPLGTEERGDYVLLIDLQRLDGNFNEKAVLESYWTLLDKNDKPIARGIYSAEEMVPGADYNLLVNAESALVRGFGKHLAQKLPPHLK